jgi:hypothetical protein
VGQVIPNKGKTFQELINTAHSHSDIYFDDDDADDGSLKGTSLPSTARAGLPPRDAHSKSS